HRHWCRQHTFHVGRSSRNRTHDYWCFYRGGCYGPCRGYGSRADCRFRNAVKHCLRDRNSVVYVYHLLKMVPMFADHVEEFSMPLWVGSSFGGLAIVIGIITMVILYRKTK